MSNETLSAAAPDNLPRVPAGKSNPESLATGNAAGATVGNDAAKNSAPAKIPFGGNVGKKVRADGLKPGSPEALAADRAKDAQRKRDERAAKAAATPPPPLPSRPAPPLAELENKTPAQIAAVDSVQIAPVDLWVADDLRQCSVEIVSLVESWRVISHTKRAIKGNLPPLVVDEIKKDAAFPPDTKKSLSNSSPATLAKMFNELNVPVSLKSIVTTAPALLYLIVRDLQTGSRIEKLIQQNNAAQQPEKKTP